MTDDFPEVADEEQDERDFFFEEGFLSGRYRGLIHER